MKPEYDKWIREHYPNPTAAYGECKTGAEEMVKAFPELRVARGFFHSISWGERQHWWCVVVETGEIVDPTGHQFPGGGSHEELVGTDEEIASRVPTGVCMDCGDPVYNGDTFCSSSCENATIAYLNDIGREDRGYDRGGFDG